FYKGFAVTEMEVNHRERTNGRSRYGLERYARGFLDLLTAVFMSRYTRRPMHVFGGIGLLLFLPGSFALIWLAALKIIFGAAIGGRPLLVLGGVLCVIGLQLMLTGLVAEMISAPRAAEVPYSPVIVLPDTEADGTAVATEVEPSVVVLSEDELARVQPLRRRRANRERG